MPTSVLEIVSTLLPADGHQRTDLVIEQFDQWYNPASANLGNPNPGPTSCFCGCGNTTDDADGGE